MAIPSRQIGGSTTTNLLWQISKQLEELICVRSGGCGNTTTTNYNVAGCERMEYHVISYTGEGVLPEGTIVNNATPECWFIIDQTTDPADVGTVTYVWPTLNECAPCVDSHITTTTTTTAAPGPICDTYFNITGSPFATISYTDCNGVQIVNAEVNIITSVCVTPGTVTGEVEAFEVYPNTCNP